MLKEKEHLFIIDYFKYFLLSLLFLWIMRPCPIMASSPDQYQAMPGLIDLRSNFSDGDHSIEELAELARSRGFKILFINDHARVHLEYGLPPFRHILKIRRQRPSIMTHGPQQYLNAVQQASRRFPDMIIIPGCIVSPYYYWSGSWFKGNLTVHEYDRKLLVLNFNQPQDYRDLPGASNSWSLQYTRALLPGLVLYLVPFLIGGFLLLKKRRKHFGWGLFLVVFSILAMIDYNPFRRSLHSPYHPETNLKPYQEAIEYINRQGGLAFWNYPEQRSGIRKIGSVSLSTPPYPELIAQTLGYAGFAAIYGDQITLIDPGREWDQALTAYCRGTSRNPPWGIAAADFHGEGRLKLKLGAFPTTFLLREFSKAGVLEAIQKGRMYASQGDGLVWPRIENFHAIGALDQKAVMGETLVTVHRPVIRFKITYDTDKKARTAIHLIRGGEIIESFEAEPSMEVEYLDQTLSPGMSTYYRLMDSRKHLVSNPIFVKYTPPAPGQ